jgi:basic endochitinase B
MDAGGRDDASSLGDAALDSGIVPVDGGVSEGVDARTSEAGSDAGTSEGSDAGVSELGDILSRAMFEEMFPHRGSSPCPGAFFTYDALLAAAARFPAFASTGTADERRREVSAFLANASHETTGGWPTAPDGPQAWGLCFIEEVGCAGGGCTGYCDASSAAYPCATGQTYHGRGPMQLSWNYNYGQCGDALGRDLLSDPSAVTRDPELAFMTALWFWMTPQAPKPSCHDVMTGGFTPSASDVAAGRVAGLGLTIDIINGGLECDRPTDGRVEDRVAFHRRYSALLGVDPGPALYCDTMEAY